MKQKFRFMFFLMVAFAITVKATAQETRSFSKSWPVGDIETLQVINKYGEVRVSDNGSNQVTVNVRVEVEGSGSRAQEVLDDISVNFSLSGKKAVAETKFSSSFRSKGRFSIDYTIFIPASKNLMISNKFGNVVMQNLTGKGTIDIGYGNLTAGRLHTPGADGLSINLEYGKADIESVQDAGITVSYSKLFLKNGGTLTLTTKYSTVEIDKAIVLGLDSKYDTFSFGTLDNLSAESKFSNYKIGTLTKRLKMESGYGSIRVEHIPAGFDELEVNSSFAQVSLGIEAGAAYSVEASCEFCTIEYPQTSFNGNRIKENTSQSIEGKVAGGGTSRIRVTSRYGNIKLVR